MKKLSLSIGLAAIFLCLSCSDDDKKTEPHGVVTFSINGEQKELNDVDIFPSQVFQFGNEDYQSAFITTEEENIAIRITFPIKADHAPQGDGSIEYLDGSNEFYGFEVDVNYTENSPHKLKGTFSGTFSNGMNGQDEQTRTVSNGTFDINY